MAHTRFASILIPMRQLTSRPQATPVLLAVTAAFALWALAFTFHVSGDLRTLLNDWVYDNIVFAAGAACLARGIIVRRDRVAWILMGLAVTSWGAGDTVWTVTIGDDPVPPAPSFADLGYLAVYPFACVSIVLLLKSRIGSLRGGLWLDGVIGAFAIGAVGAAIILPAVIGTLGG